MPYIKKIIAVVAIALMTAAGSAAPAEAKTGSSVPTQTGGGWCC